VQLIDRARFVHISHLKHVLILSRWRPTICERARLKGTSVYVAHSRRGRAEGVEILPSCTQESPQIERLRVN